MQLMTPQTLTDALEARLSRQPTVLLALDGRCGSGKTTLASGLARHFGKCILAHTDDFYLPPARRVPGWQSIPCANMDLERLQAEVLAPARQGRGVCYRAYSCRQGEYLPPVLLEAAPLVILEGSYSLHPSLAAYYDMEVFVTCSAEEQARRLQAREGERYPDFVRRWIPLEEAYFARHRIPQQAQFTVVTG